MPTRTSYQPGTPSWIDLSTPDPEASKAFYGGLFGWEFTAEPTDQGEPYHMAHKKGAAVAGMMRQMPEQAAQGMPPMWASYVSVDDVDATVAKVEPAGGAVLMPPMDVMDSGRMALVADPTGGVIGLWQPKNHIGAGLVNEHGSLTWNELTTPDIPAAAAFYEAVLGWTAETADMGGMAYTTFLLHGDGVAGGMNPPMEGMPTFWGVYFAVDDCDGIVGQATAAGATVLAEPMDIPIGRMAALMDPQGAAFSVIQLADPPSA